MRRITVVTVGRSDFGILTPVLHAIDVHPELELNIVASGAHLSSEFGLTVNEIFAAGFQVTETVDMLLSADTPAAITKSMGLAMIGFAQVWERLKPEMIVLLGDRFEMHAAAVSAVPFRIPLAHIHGGEVTIGAIDEAFRHSITKCSHLHFTSTQDYANRVMQLGEEPWRVTVSGAPALDLMRTGEKATRSELEERLEISLDAAPLLVTFHPLTLQFEQAADQIAELLTALETFTDRPVVITKPNADTNGRIIIEHIDRFAATHDNVRFVDNLGSRNYFGLMKFAAVMVGNSSSGIIEAASYGLPVVNVGMRQEGRTQSGNVIDVDNDSDQIVSAIRTAIDPKFRMEIASLENIYGDGHSVSRIVDRLASEPLNARLITKRFYDLFPQSEFVKAA
jgi:UDP-hydrolysing UDP-N-acetyl-D-glucosamine 2-epimerase